MYIFVVLEIFQFTKNKKQTTEEKNCLKLHTLYDFTLLTDYIFVFNYKFFFILVSQFLVQF